MEKLCKKIMLHSGSCHTLLGMEKPQKGYKLDLGKKTQNLKIAAQKKKTKIRQKEHGGQEKVKQISHNAKE